MKGRVFLARFKRFQRRFMEFQKHFRERFSTFDKPFKRFYVVSVGGEHCSGFKGVSITVSGSF